MSAIEQPISNPQFPNVIESETAKGEVKQRFLATIPNLRYLLRHYGITVEYNEILKLRSIYFAGEQESHDLENEHALATIKSLCALNSLPLSTIDLLPALFTQNTVNPVVEWITSTPWDGNDRFKYLFDSLRVDDADIEYRNRIVECWLIQCVAAADNGKIGCEIHRDAQRKFEYALILQGSQGAGKTKWFRSLVPNHLSQYVKDGMNLNPDDRDSVKKCITTWICELGEIGATFRKSDLERLKAFMSNQTDEMRLAYDRTESNFKRRTSFCGSVNQEQFFVDATGSRRFMPLQVLNCTETSHIDKQQLWAQAWHYYTFLCRKWYPDSELDALIKQRSEIHNEISAIGELVAEFFNVNDSNIGGLQNSLSPTKILIDCGIREPKRNQVKELNEFLTAKGFKLKQGNDGVRGYKIAKLIKTGY